MAFSIKGGHNIAQIVLGSVIYGASVGASCVCICVNMLVCVCMWVSCVWILKLHAVDSKGKYVSQFLYICIHSCSCTTMQWTSNSEVFLKLYTLHCFSPCFQAVRAGPSNTKTIPSPFRAGTSLTSVGLLANGLCYSPIHLINITIPKLLYTH